MNDVYTKYFINLFETNDDEQRTEMYKGNVKRSKLKKSAVSYESYLKSLDQHIQISRNVDLDRVFQLIQKTNQFNLTTKRYTRDEIQNIFDSEDSFIFSASVNDTFGDNGVVNVVILKNTDIKTLEVDVFLLSCRVMGRFIENSIMDYIIDYFKELEYEKITGRFIVTSKNMPASDFYERAGFELVEDSGAEQLYQLDMLCPGKLNSKKFSTIEEI